MSQINNKSAFTLIEVLLYISILGIVLTAGIGTYITILDVRTKSFAINEVDSQGTYIMNSITQTIRNAESINTPASGQTQTLSIQTNTPAENPTVFQLNNGVVEMTQSGGSAIDLTSSDVEISNLNFTNNTRTGTPTIIQITFDIEYSTQSNSNKFDYTASFEGSAMLKP